MSIPEDTSTNDIVKKLPNLVDEYNKSSNQEYQKAYENFMQKRRDFLSECDENFRILLGNLSFCEKLREILSDFGLNYRGAKLVSARRILDTFKSIRTKFELLSSAGVTLYNLDPKSKLENRSISSLIREIFRYLEKTNRISEAGGYIAASKSMHFVLPQLFIMIDGQHIAISLYRISCSDYKPYSKDGSTWADVLPNYSGNKPNPSPRGSGRKLWDGERYIIALMYFKRIVREWCQHNNATLDEFLEVDSSNNKLPSRIIDKALW